MKLHIFNPEHEISLAYDREYVTMPHLVRQFRHDLAFLPVIWARDGDAILVDDVPSARRDAEKWLGKKPEVVFMTKDEITVMQLASVAPWGWNRQLRRQLKDAGMKDHSLPDDTTLRRIRDMANRVQTILLMSQLREGFEDITVGDPIYCGDFDEVRAMATINGLSVMKAPWSSSGRGVKYIGTPIDLPLQRWCRNVIKKQGGIIVEPYYNKVKDFAMEFVSNGRGFVRYAGLSLFDTVNGAYQGNILATEATKEKMLSRYVDPVILRQLQYRICSIMAEELKGIYDGPFGVDMMIVTGKDGKGFRIDPCVEINLRMTMGHVALHATTQKDDETAVMRVVYDKEKFKLKINKL